MPTLKQVYALEILDSRGRPTIKATIRLSSGAHASASVPSGASTGSAEAIELRDGDKNRYAGLGCRKAVVNINREIALHLIDRDFQHQAALDQVLLKLDGTPNKSRLGANAILAVSIAFARACAAEKGMELHRHFTSILADSKAASPATGQLPRLTINLFSGGKHAGGQVEFQDVLLVPLAPTIAQGLADVDAVYRAAEKLIARKYGMRSLKADEGGLAPPFANVRAMLEDARESIQAAGFTLGREMAIAVDVASTQFFHDGKYHFASEQLTADGMIDRIAAMANEFHIVSVEDALSEDDWNHWPQLHSALKSRNSLTLGDDFLCTNPTRIRRAIESDSADALLLKVNQIGTVTEAAESYRLAKDAHWRVTVSARSGETEDDWLADLAVGWSADQIKVGSVRQSERLAKYNRLLEIEAATGWEVIGWPGQR